MMASASAANARIRLNIPAGIDPIAICGPSDENLHAIEDALDASVVLRGDALSISGDPGEVELAVSLIDALIDAACDGDAMPAEDLRHMIASLRGEHAPSSSFRDEVLIAHRGRSIRPKTVGQRRYVDAIRSHSLTFCLGPAGTGKTYLAMAVATAALLRHEVGRIVLTRPVVEAGESLGFLPGTLEEKVDPYLRPLQDALMDMIDPKRVSELFEHGVIEVAPLAYMRGRTLNDAYVILDEAQNATPEQLKMFLTRMGFNSKFIVTGDASQSDVRMRRGGFGDVERILGEIEDIAFVHLGRADIVRHSLVARIVEAYDRFDETSEGGCHGRSHQ